jgi:hypothetical protein
MRTYYLSKSSRKNKKYVAKSEGEPPIHFGDSRYEDYTMHGDDERKKRYILRHGSRVRQFAPRTGTCKHSENWNDLKKAGAWSVYLLWSKKTLKESIKKMEYRFGIRIIY